MTDPEKAAKIIEALKTAEGEPAQIALPILNGLAGLVQGSGEASLEVEEARSAPSSRSGEIAGAASRPAHRWPVVPAMSATER
jgi:hypothetical protein